MRFSTLFSAAVATTVVLSAAPSFVKIPSSRRSLAALAVANVTLPPSLDEFYTPPTGYEKEENGAVLRYRAVSTSLDALSTAYQVLYKTQDVNMDADATVTTILVPTAPPAIDTAARDCTTSYSLVTGTQSSDVQSQDLIESVAALSKGWYVTIPDHEGSKAAFTVGRTEAQAGLDGLRALLNFPAAIPRAKNYSAVIRGYSGGGHASAWSMTYLPRYAPELNVVGAAFGGVPMQLDWMLDLLSGTGNTSFAFAGLAGLGNAYPKFKAWEQDNLYPNGTALFAHARDNANCVVATSNETDPYANADVYSVVIGGANTLYEGLPATLVKENELGVNTTDNSGVLPSNIPIFMYHRKTDEIVSYAPVKPYYVRQCAQGANNHLVAVSQLSHVETFLYSLGDAYAFLESAFDGAAPLDGCKETYEFERTVLSTEYDEAIGAVAAAELTAYIAAEL